MVTRAMAARRKQRANHFENLFREARQSILGTPLAAFAVLLHLAYLVVEDIRAFDPQSCEYRPPDHGKRICRLCNKHETASQLPDVETEFGDSSIRSGGIRLLRLGPGMSQILKCELVETELKLVL